jgi:hypothetical protein
MALRRAPNHIAGILLVLLMAVGSVVMWLVIPLGLVYGASHLSKAQQPSMGIYVGLFIAVPSLMVLMARVLGRLDRAYARVMGIPDDKPYRPGWMKSMRAERVSSRRRTVLDIVMVLSVGLAILCATVWFFAFAGSSLPG